MVQPKSTIHLSAGRLVTAMPFIHGASTSELGRPLGFAGSGSHSRAKSPGTSNGPPLVSPMKATPLFLARRRAFVRSIPAVRSVWTASTTSPSSRRAGGDPIIRLRETHQRDAHRGAVDHPRFIAPGAEDGPVLRRPLQRPAVRSAPD